MLKVGGCRLKEDIKATLDDLAAKSQPGPQGGLTVEHGDETDRRGKKSGRIRRKKYCC